MKAALYVRVSSDEQARDGVSLDAQQRDLIAYCRSQDWSVADIYRDEGWSGKNLDRPAVQRLLADARKGGFGIVLVWKVDRLTRRLSDLLHVLQDVLDPAGIGFRSARESFDTTTPLGKAMLHLLGVFAELERENIRERVRMARKELATQGRWAGGRAPFGYRWDGPRLEVDDAAAPHVREIFAMAARGHGLRTICAAMQERGAPHPWGAAWNHVAVARILSSRAYLGEVVHLGAWQPGRHDPLVTVDAWERANAVRATHANRPSHRSLLAGLALCARCGCRLRLDRHGPTRWYYRCTGREHDRTSCDLPSLPMGAVDAIVLGRVCGLAGSADAMRSVLGAGDDAELAALRREDGRLAKTEAEARRRLSAWYDAVEQGQIGIPELRERLGELDRERDAAAKRRLEIASALERAVASPARAAEVRRRIREFCAELPQMPPDDQRAALRGIVAWVRVDDGPAVRDMRFR